MRDKKNDSARLVLMKEEVSNIEQFLSDTHSKEEFVANKLLCHAVAWNLQCIGENVYKLSSDFIENHQEIDWKSIEGLRHVLVHDYYNVNMEMLWEIIESDMPKLKHYLELL